MYPCNCSGESAIVDPRSYAAWDELHETLVTYHAYLTLLKFRTCHFGIGKLLKL
jgi:hypothetical protein